MRRYFAAILILSPLYVLAADQPTDKDKDKKKPTLTIGANIPGPFHPFNVTGRYGPHKVKDEEVEGTYHCPVTEHSEDPMVLVFTRDLQIDEKDGSIVVGEKIMSLAKKLDEATRKNTGVRLAATIVFLNKEIPEVLGKDNKTEDLRRDVAATLREKFTGMFTEINPFTKQNLVIVCIGSAADLAKYELDVNHKATVVLYNKLEIKAVHAVEELDDARIDAIMKDVSEKLGATKK